jgi:hypothetical protein
MRRSSIRMRTPGHPVLVAFRSRRTGFAAGWVLLWSTVAYFVADRFYLFQVATGTDPRPLALVELIPVLAACSVPALATPQLWSWERIGSRVVVPAISGIVAPATILAIAVIPQACFVLGRKLPLPPNVAFSNTLIFGSIATLTCIWLGPRLGPTLGTSAYLIGVGVQGLEVELPVPVRASSGSPWAHVTLALVVLALATVCMFASLGRTQIRLD